MVGCIDRREKDRLIRYLRTELIHGSDSKITSGNNSRLFGCVYATPLIIAAHHVTVLYGRVVLLYNSRISTVQDTLYSTDVPYYVRAVLRSAKRRITGI